MMRVALLAGGLGAALMGCETEPAVAYAELGEVCGESGPFRVLELGADEFIHGYTTRRVGDRSFYVVHRFDPGQPDGLWDGDAEPTVWAVGPCGESPVQVASGFDYLFVLDVWPEVVLACDKSAGNLVMLDPSGAVGPQVVMSGLSGQSPDCADQWTEFGALDVIADGEDAWALRLHPYPSQPGGVAPAPVVLLDDILVGNSPGLAIEGEFRYRFGALYMYSDHAFALTGDGALVRVELADGTVSTLQTDVLAFAAAADGATILWQERAGTSVDRLGNEVSNIYLRAPGSDEDVLLGETSLNYDTSPFDWVDHGIFTLAFDLAGERVRRIYRLPGLEWREVPRGTSIEVPLPDGSWIGRSNGWIRLLDLAANINTPMFPRPAELARVEDDAIIVREVPPCCGDAYFDSRSEGALWRVRLDGKQATRLAERATTFMQPMSDGRSVTALDIGANWLSTLVILDSESGEERRIDERVNVLSFLHRSPIDGMITYSVADGARSGVYVANLSAAGGSP